MLAISCKSWLGPILTRFLFTRHITNDKHAMTDLGSRDKGKSDELPAELRYIQYEHALEKQYLPSIRALISKDLSEPYSIYVYRYFLYQWGDLCFMVLLSTCSLVGNSKA
jgi:hypothetical protein